MDDNSGLKDGPLCIGKDHDSLAEFQNETLSLDTIDKYQ
jgi:hypothetical protein